VSTRLTLIACLYAGLGLSGCGGIGNVGNNGGAPPTPTFTGNWEINLMNSQCPNSVCSASAYLSEGGTNVSGQVAFDTQIICGRSSAGSGNGTLQNDMLNLAFIGGGQPGSPGFQFFVQMASVGFTTTEVFSGQYQLSSQCATTDGMVSGQQIPSFAGTWAGTVQLQGQPSTVQIAISITEGPVDSSGFPTVSGPVTIAGTPCFATGTLSGNQEGINLNSGVNTADGFITTNAVLDSAGQLGLSFGVNSGSCGGDSGTAVLTRQ
jgi:hypothetical protein